MKKNYFAFSFVVLLVFLFVISGCKTTKKLSSDPPPKRELSEVLAALNKRNIDFSWFSAKASGDFESPQFGGSGNMQLRIKKDSLIWMVGKKFSIEGFRTLINKDSFYVVNRLERFYTEEPLNKISNLFGMNMIFEDMQQLLAGNVFLPDTSQILNYSQSENTCTLLTQIDDYKVTYTLDANNLYLTGFEIKDRYGRKAIASFDKYDKFQKNKIPFIRNYTFYDVNKVIAKLDVEISEIELDVPKTMNFSIPSHYERVRF